MTRKSLESLELNVIYKSIIKETVTNALNLNLNYLTKIILFGSCARNEIKLGSDIDLMYITNKKLNDVKERTLLYGTDPLDKIDVDIVIYTEEELARKENKFTDFIHRDGIIIWESGECNE